MDLARLLPAHEEAGGDGADAEAEDGGAELGEQGLEEGDDGGGDLLGKARGVDLDLGRWVGLGVGRCCALTGDSVVHCGLGRVLDGEEAEGVARERNLALAPSRRRRRSVRNARAGPARRACRKATGRTSGRSSPPRPRSRASTRWRESTRGSHPTRRARVRLRSDASRGITSRSSSRPSRAEVLASPGARCLSVAVILGMEPLVRGATRTLCRRDGPLDARAHTDADTVGDAITPCRILATRDAPL